MKNNKILKIGIDVGSTTLKMVVLNSDDEIVYKNYVRHKADVNNVLMKELEILRAYHVGKDTDVRCSITGSAGMGVTERLQIPFAQEVIAAIEVIKRLYPDTRTLIDLGGEDAKIVFFEEERLPDIRMNGSCAGGTGAFIDQMADLLNLSLPEMSSIAENYTKTYNVASRCGVFAKTDVQNLIARNISKADIAMSVFQTIALQTITTLVRGNKILPKVLCVGGPLTFIPALRQQFKMLLDLQDNDIILPENSEYFPAFGCAFLSEKNSNAININDLITKLSEKKIYKLENSLAPFFENQEQYQLWKENRNIKPLKYKELQCGEAINCFLGVDSGSTTTKILILDENENIVFTYYAANQGNSLEKLAEGLNKFKTQCKEKGVAINIAASCSTGYGEELIKQAFNLDFGIVETMAHLQGAQWVKPDVSFVLDIGGQDMKSIFVQDGVISNIELNEACSSGCGSFLQNFAATMNLPLSEFTQAACLAKSPADLGTRCTVFMNSKVKQSLRENATIGDIAAGLAYSVVKNCLFKVLKINNLNVLGNNIVVQGGTFRNDAVYRALELLSGKQVSSTDMPEIMGALGAALFAKKMKKNACEEQNNFQLSTLNSQLKYETRELNCKGCTNKCSVLKFIFENGNVCYSGNKCEKVFFSKHSIKEKGRNFFEEKNEILFDTPTNTENTNKITVGIPRILNMYENFPFWKTLFEHCGFEVVISPESNMELYKKGVSSVMSDNICFPAKLAHGHIISLVEAKVDRIFYPIVPKEEKVFAGCNNSYNCPIVSGYPEVVRSAIDAENNFGIPFDKPVINFANENVLKEQCFNYLSQFNIDKNVFELAFEKANFARTNYNRQFIENQKDILEKSIKNGDLCFIVAGRPYHADLLINQKTGQIFSDLGVNVLTDDVFRNIENDWKNLNFVSQWSYPNSVVQAALQVAKLPQNIQLLQLNSFGCGPDSFLLDEVGEILRQAGKNHTILRIDEISSSGSIRLRLRSLIESINQTKNHVSK